MATILVTDDDAHIREVVRYALERAGHKVIEAADGTAALKEFEKQPIDLVVLDIQLDQESGLELLQHIAEKQEDIAVILCTAYSSYKDDFSSWLADGYVVKSSNLDELKSEVRRILAQK